LTPAPPDGLGTVEDNRIGSMRLLDLPGIVLKASLVCDNPRDMDRNIVTLQVMAEKKRNLIIKGERNGGYS
jgi:hypothetical protein